ncbi:hypothetical protein E2C01_001807 [Portunus trituberculatus]|uniref:Uncharacterized protein n=1 Tax=Portunus trituberculatus TaxID=210409 RepID=A0A5B7CKF4_PORTR|nr:hypothetical protein [Portunus trituberculatus]
MLTTGVCGSTSQSGKEGRFERFVRRGNETVSANQEQKFLLQRMKESEYMVLGEREIGVSRW